MKNKMKKGFSLIELMIVIVILGLLASFILPNLTDKVSSAKKDLTCIQMKNIYDSELDMFKLDNDVYPTTEEGLKALILNPNPEKYKKYPKNGYFKDKEIPKDSWNNNFVYLNKKNKIELISFGSDGKEGGSNSAEDIYLSKCQ